MQNSLENFRERIGQSRSLARVKSEILSRILERGLGKARERHEEDEGLDGLKGLKMGKSM